MTQSKLNLVDSDPFCTEKLKALADPTRYSVVRSLIEKPMTVSELAARLEIEQSLLSHHLSVLRSAKLVFAERSGRSFRYRLANEINTDAGFNGIDLECCRLVFN